MAGKRKPYVDITGKPLQADDVALVCRVLAITGNTSLMNVSRSSGVGVARAGRILTVLEKANVVTPKGADGKRKLLLRHEAAMINAALRTLRKGKS